MLTQQQIDWIRTHPMPTPALKKQRKKSYLNFCRNRGFRAGYSFILTGKINLNHRRVSIRDAEKQARERADQILRALTEAYRGEDLSGTKIELNDLDIKKSDLIGRKYAKQNVVIRLKKSLMDYYPVQYTDKTVKVSTMPEYKIFTMFFKI